MENPQAPHVLMLPFPAVGHIKPMLMLGKLLCQAGLSVTLLNTDQNHNNILNLIDQSSFYSRYIPRLPIQVPRRRFATWTSTYRSRCGGVALLDYFSLQYKVQRVFHGWGKWKGAARASYMYNCRWDHVFCYWHRRGISYSGYYFPNL